MPAAPRRPYPPLDGDSRCVATLSHRPESVPALIEYAPQHQGFVHVLQQLGLPLAVARFGEHYCLGIWCESGSEAVQRASEIAAMMKRRPRLAARMRETLEFCAVRVIEGSFALMWPALVVQLITLQ